MEISTAHIKYFKKSGFDSVSNENETHVKVLPYLSVVQSLEGNYDIALGNGQLEHTEEGGFFIAPAGVKQHIVHHTNKKSGKMTCRWIFIDVEINKMFSLDALYQFPTVINDDRMGKINALFDRIFSTNDVWDNYSDCYKLLGCLVQTATPLKNETHRGVQRAITYIKEHYQEQITVGVLAKAANMSESNFYAAFKKHVENSPIAYLNQYRLSIAADKLILTDQTISELSCSVGIIDALYFSKLFKKTYGISPKKYRLVYRNDYSAS